MVTELERCIARPEQRGVLADVAGHTPEHAIMTLGELRRDLNALGGLPDDTKVGVLCDPGDSPVPKAAPLLRIVYTDLFEGAVVFQSAVKST
jgi:hypothetical protein